MAADVSSLVRLINGGESANSAKSTAPITRDLLQGCSTLDSKELDLDLQVPCGWEKRLDLKSGKVSVQRCNSSSEKLQDLNFPPTLNLFKEDGLDLKLVSLSSSPPSSYQSVCTLDKVKSALERAEKETVRKRSSQQQERSAASFAAGCPSCLMYVLISRGNPRCPRCNSNVPLPPPAPAKKPRIDLNITI